ncbi:MAG: PD-(D/E)XK nuclease family protein [Candidatus Paceibacterota bacterium]
MDESLLEDLRDILDTGIKSSMIGWTGKSLYFTKSQFLSSLRCEGQMLADSNRGRVGIIPAVVVGVITHRAVQLAHTHPGKSVADYIKFAIVGARTNDPNLDEWWASAGASSQSDIITQATSKVINFIDDWPVLNPKWSPRFEESITAKVGGVTLSCRADLVLGRPRSDKKQSLLIVDLKSGSLTDEHKLEAMFYALVATLRHGVAPWRSTVYSLSSGEWTDGDVTKSLLLETANLVVKAIKSHVDVLAEIRPPILSPGDHCRWCPAKLSCAESTFIVSEESKPIS